ncbi:hypothetical protein HD806DRAFT_523418 [Xylariaceae sp. AK1471]|nr:hypothetical protein HD806DRAFT_523418 [Xylariaceae sp. AK1471]
MELIDDSMSSFTAGDLHKVFAYSQAPATVFRLLQPQAILVEEECITEQDWESLIQESLPSISNNGGDSGFVLLIAPRIPGNVRSKSSTSLTSRNGEDEKSFTPEHEATICDNEESLGRGGQRQTRVLPFSRDVFSRVSKALYTHRSISPAINRADVPLFSYEEVMMQDNVDGVKREAWVYNCRSTNAWGSDLAMTVTHFPHCRLSFGMLFGCPESQKKYIRRQLRSTIYEPAHPLLLPAIFAEIERTRHHIIFEAGVDKLELTMPHSNMEALLDQQQLKTQQDKRVVYLEMLHLKHELTSWSKQLDKMVQHALALDKQYHGLALQVDGLAMMTSCGYLPLDHRDPERPGDVKQSFPLYDEDAPIYQGQFEPRSAFDPTVSPLETARDSDSCQAILRRTNTKIVRRLNTILEDYSNKVRECQTRFDGLTMTTQLFQGETSVLLALATSKDSRHMRTIALVTMVFLPGTFFATIFSMTFFNWQAADGESTVSSFFWIYIVFSVVSTAVTLLVYYYVGTLRPKKALSASVLEQSEV